VSILGWNSGQRISDSWRILKFLKGAFKNPPLTKEQFKYAFQQFINQKKTTFDDSKDRWAWYAHISLLGQGTKKNRNILTSMAKLQRRWNAKLDAEDKRAGEFKLGGKFKDKNESKSYSSFKKDKLLMESWRSFLNEEAGQKASEWSGQYMVVIPRNN